MAAPERLGLGPRRTKADLLSALRRGVEAIPGIRATFGQPIGHRIDHMLSGTRASIAVKIFGSDLSRLRGLAKQVEECMRSVPGVVDLSTEQQATVSSLRVQFERAALARHGITIEEAAQALQARTLGVGVTEILEGRNTFDLVVLLRQEGALTTESLGDTPVAVAAEGGLLQVPLSAVADIQQERVPNLISRENVQRKIVVMCNVAERDVGGVVDDIRRSVTDSVELPQGYYVEYGGQFESATETNRRLLLIGCIVVLVIGFLLHLAFRSARDAGLIMVNFPLALIGGVAGVLASGETLTVASLIGFITVFGIAARNGIMLVSHVRHLQLHEGVADYREAVRRGAMERLAPIVMTALAAGLALIPLALRGEKPGTEILTPMAVVILFGLLSSTFLNMIVLPTLLLRLGLPAETRQGAPSEVSA